MCQLSSNILKIALSKLRCTNTFLRSRSSSNHSSLLAHHFWGSIRSWRLFSWTNSLKKAVSKLFNFSENSNWRKILYMLKCLKPESEIFKTENHSQLVARQLNLFILKPFIMPSLHSASRSKICQSNSSYNKYTKECSSINSHC